MNFRFAVLTITLNFMVSTPTWARVQEPEIPVRFGPEFTFLAPAHEEPTFLLDRIVERQHDHLVTGQPEGAKFKRETLLNSFASPNGWFFSMSTDPGVIEVQMKPMTWLDYDRYKADIQDAVFVSAANEGGRVS